MRTRRALRAQLAKVTRERDRLIDPGDGYGLGGDLARYARLIRWLAMPWDANDPHFPQEDPYSGAPLPGNVELAATWREVVRSEG